MNQLPTPEALAAEIEKVAQEFPDVLYIGSYDYLGDTCYYDRDNVSTVKPDGCPEGCLVGVALKNLGFIFEGFDYASNELSEISSVESFYYRLDKVILKDTDAGRFIMSVQRSQDGASTWRSAVLKARESSGAVTPDMILL